MSDAVGIYARISVDRQGRREGVEAQERWGREYAAQHWPGRPVRVFIDNDLSAAKDERRPGYDELRAAIEVGEIRHLWSVEQSRLERREVEWFQLAALLVTAGIDELHTQRDGVVRVADDVAGIKAVLNAGEVRRLKRRVRDRLDELAAQGRPAGGAFFGYRRVVDEHGTKTLAIVPEQAETLRWAADAVLSGWSLTNVAAELRRRGHRGVLGGKLGTSAVRSMLLAPVSAGLRVHRGEIVGRGNWQPILDEATWRQVRARLINPRVVIQSNGASFTVTPALLSQRAGRKYLLTGGLVRCDVCKAPLVGLVKQFVRSNGTKRIKPYLMCSRTVGGKACVGIMLESVEQHVVGELFAELDKPEFVDRLFTDEGTERRDQIVRELADLDQQRAELARVWAGGRGMSTIEWQSARSALDMVATSLRAQLAAVPESSTRPDIAVVRELWNDPDGLTLDEKREFLRTFIDVVWIGRGQRGNRGFQSDRVDIEWKTA